VSEPTATLTLDARKKSGAKVELGETELEPDIVFALEADTAHELLNGELNLTTALASGAIATKGPVTKVLKLLPVTLELSKAPAAEAPAAEPEAPEAEAPEAEAPEAEAPEAEAPEAEAPAAAPEEPSAE
jgi:hypothetical protein